MDRILKFDYMWKDTLCTSVEVNWTKQTVVAVDYVDDCVKQVFGKRPHTIEVLLKFFEERCFSRERPDKDILLEIIGLKEYNPLDICKKTHGLVLNEFSWIRFEGENYVWEEMKTGKWKERVL